MNAPALRARSVGEILDLAFQLYRSRWKQMATATGVLVLPLLVLEAVVPLEMLGMMETVAGLFFLAASAAVVVIASEAYMGREVAAADAVRTVGRRFLSVWGAAMFQGILVFLGLLLFIIPGIIAMALTFVMQQAVMIEGKTTNEAYQRSRSLAEGEFTHILLTGVLAFFIVMFAMMGFGAVIGLGVADVRLATLLTNVALIAINPLTAVVGTVLYYDLRIRKEAFDVSVATDRLAELPVEPVPAY
ncbi:MAG: hypothetical protein KY467_13315 [Gemmatimonadetes bacterium]|nr:hypothetical protein [Gemmatimonadota bacterium]